MLKIRDFDLEIKAGADGAFEGYGSVFGVVDSYSEIVAAGAFAESLKVRKRPLPILWQHRNDSPIGVYDKVTEDSKGLHVKGRLLVKDVALAAEAHALMKAGAVTGLSIGYWTRESSFDEKTGIRTLTRLDLEEVSLVTFPANDEARVDAVKLKLAHGTIPTIPEFERLLRDAGFSRTQAATVAAYGLKHLLRDADGPATETAASELLETLQGFSLPF
ncbi:MAG TPA: HK97 family phage prohead protease [Devosia sp.]|nr:HK97 family phage prohead protease [Devosia sp.]